MMKRILSVLITAFLLLPNLAIAGGADAVMGAFVFIIIVAPYYLASLIPYLIQKKNKGRSIMLSILSYFFCLVGIALANLQFYGVGLPRLSRLDDDDLLFFFIVMPFILIIIKAAKKDYSFRKYGIED